MAFIAADLPIQFRARSVAPADDLIRFQKNAPALRARKEISPHHAHFIVVIPIGNGLSLPRHRGDADDGIVRRLPHDFRELVVGMLQKRAGAVDGRQLRVIPAEQTLYLETQ